mmetsp:Transcript_11739/g.49243  ORF Transcript_11739/g.49243 Transcript_11739/m.49243 type:complete len:200 (+) Transcript_11739:982-1581(+)
MGGSGRSSPQPPRGKRSGPKNPSRRYFPHPTFGPRWMNCVNRRGSARWGAPRSRKGSRRSEKATGAARGIRFDRRRRRRGARRRRRRRRRGRRLGWALSSRGRVSAATTRRPPREPRESPPSGADSDTTRPRAWRWPPPPRGRARAPGRARGASTPRASSIAARCSLGSSRRTTIQVGRTRRCTSPRRRRRGGGGTGSG